LQLESVFDDSTLRQTRFVLLHGGWPYADQTLAAMMKPNVYADISAMTQILSPATLAGVLRMWLEEFPGKVLYGSDAYADHNSDPVGWGDQGWVAAHTARRALAMALTAMMRDGTVTRAGAQEIAQMVLRGNALGLYHFGAVSSKS
jgi:predicted TIM-barrel fold metal-dependent hydrolase